MNEDHILAEPDLGLFALFDGGGHWGDGPSPAGSRGADIIRRVIAGGAPAEESRALIDRALRTAGHFLQTQPAADGCRYAASVVLAWLREGRVSVSWLGDAMAHRVSNDTIAPLTRAHTYLNELLSRGLLTQETLQRNGTALHRVLIHVLGNDLPDSIEVVSFNPDPGDRVILTTDGVHDVLQPGELLAVCRAHPEPQACAERLVALALERGSHDNCTCVVITFERAGNGPPPESPPPATPRRWWR